MARTVVGALGRFNSFFKQVTAIGNSVRTRPKTKHTRRHYKQYTEHGKWEDI